MLTQKWLCLWIAIQVDELLLMLTIIVGGSIERPVADVTVAPVRSSPRPAVMTETPPANVRSARFTAVASTCVPGIVPFTSGSEWAMFISGFLLGIVIRGPTIGSKYILSIIFIDNMIWSSRHERTR